MKSWLIKSEPSVYSWTQLQKDGHTTWEGVRNYAARNHLRSMNLGDWLFFYHSGASKEIVGLAKVIRTAYPDPSSPADWSAIAVAPLASCPTPVPLQVLRQDPLLQNMTMLTQNRLSVSPITPNEFGRLLKLSNIQLSW